MKLKSGVGDVYELKESLHGNDKYDLAFCYGFESRPEDNLNLEIGDPNLPKDFGFILRNGRRFIIAEELISKYFHIVGCVTDDDFDTTLIGDSEDQCDYEIEDKDLLDRMCTRIFEERNFNVLFRFNWDNKAFHPVDKEFEKLWKRVKGDSSPFISLYSLRRKLTEDV